MWCAFALFRFLCMQCVICVTNCWRSYALRITVVFFSFSHHSFPSFSFRFSCPLAFSRSPPSLLLACFLPLSLALFRSPLFSFFGSHSLSDNVERLNHFPIPVCTRVLNMWEIDACFDMYTNAALTHTLCHTNHITFLQWWIYDVFENV